MADPKAFDVPANQKVEKLPKTITNESFAQKASYRLPQLHPWIEHPRSVISFQPDPTAFFKLKPVTTQSISDFSQTSYGKGDQVILDFGSHRVGYLSFHLGIEGVNVDAPVSSSVVRIKFPGPAKHGLDWLALWILSHVSRQLLSPWRTRKR